jgi:ribosome-associated translation inhibitor RaiA
MNDLVDRVRFGGGFSERDRALVADTLSQALGRLSLSDRSWELELSVKDREAPGQSVTLEAWVPGKSRIVATSQLADLRAALNDVGDDVLRQFNKARDLRTPQANRTKRDTIRGHGA